MTKQIEALKLALERLQARTDTVDLDAIAAINEALAEQPLAQPWVGLTEEERHSCTQSPFVADNYRAIEAKLKEKNT